MPGFDNNVVYANNVDFTGASPVTGQITQDGQLLIGSTAFPNIVAGFITSTDSSVTITNSSGNINLATNFGHVSFVADLGSATFSSGILHILGTNGIDTIGSSNTVTVNFDVTKQPSIPVLINTDSGSCTPATNTFYIVGGTNCTTSASGDTITIDATGGGGGVSTLTSDSGTATESASNINVLGGTGIVTSAAADTVTIAFDVTDTGCITTVNADSGSATASSNAITINGSGTVTTSASGSTITITGSGGGGMTWTEVTGTSQLMAVNNGYILNNAALVTATLPATAAVGDIVRVVGKGAGGWRIAQNSGNIIHFGSSDTTTGVGGYLNSFNRRDCVELVCTVANNEWTVCSPMGNITVV